MLLFGCFLQVPPATATNGQIIRVGVYNNKPTIFMGEDNIPKGLFIDILEEIARREGWKLSYTRDHFSSLLDQVKSGKIDLLPAVAYSEERTRFLDFNYQTAMSNWAELYVPKSSKLMSILELEGKKIGVKQGDIHFQALKRLTRNFNIHCRFLETDGYTTVFEMVSAGFVDVGLVNRLFGNARKKEFHVRETPVIFNPIEMRFAVQKNTREHLLNVIDIHLAKMKADQNSEYYRSINRWFLFDSEPIIPDWMYRLIWFSLGLILLLFLIASAFRHQVKKKTAELRESNEQLSREIRQRTEARKRLHKLARVVETSGDGMALMDLEHRHQLFNQAYRNLFYTTEITTRKTTLAEVMGEEFFAHTMLPQIQKCFEGQTVHLQTTPTEEKTDQIIWNITLTPYHLDDGPLDGYVIDIRDVSHQMALENRLKNAQKMEAIGLLAGGVAHDLNNILSGVVSYPDLLLVNRDKDDPMVGPLTAIKKSGERAAAIVQDLLALSRRGIGEAKILQLNALVTDYLESLECRDLLKSHPGVSIATRFQEDLLRMYGSPTHLQKVVMNLVTNSVEAMSMGGVVTISTENITFSQEHLCYEAIPAGEYVALRIRDTGVGMAPREISRIFEPFYSNKILGRSGTGLGMAVVWGTVKDHLGYVDIDSFPGKGTEFSLYFPATRAVMPETSSFSLEDLKGNRELVLIVDDMLNQRDLARDILRMLNYRTTSADSGESAVEFCQHTAPDLLLLDMVMPGGMDGLETYERILAIRPKLKAVIASGFSENERVQQTLKLGAGQYIRKPYSVETLGLAIAKELSRHE